MLKCCFLIQKFWGVTYLKSLFVVMQVIWHLLVFTACMMKFYAYLYIGTF